MAVTLDDVAAASAVSRSTASRALSGDPRVRDSTRTKVKAVAQSLGYQANHAARSLAKGRTGMVALVVPETNLMQNPWVALITTGVCRAARRTGRSVNLWMDPSNADRAPDVVRHGGVDGLIVMASEFGAEWIEDVRASPLPTVMIGEHAALAELTTVGSDNDLGARLVARHLYELGHRHVGVVAGPQVRADARVRLASFLDEMEQLGEPVRHDLVVEGDFSLGSGLAGLATLLEDRPTAVFASNDLMAAGALRGLRLAGLSVPGDVSLVGFDNLPIGQDLEPALTTVNQDPITMGEIAISLMQDMIDGKPAPSTNVPVELITRRSTRAV